MAYFTLDELRELWSEMKGKPAEQNQLFRDIVDAKEAYLQHNILPELIKWLPITTAPEIVMALEIYTPQIRQDDTQRAQYIEQFKTELDKITLKGSPPSRLAICNNIAQFIEKIATTSDELLPVIIYYQNVTHIYHPEGTDYHQAVRHLRRLIQQQSDLITAETRTLLENFLEKIPHYETYTLNYHVKGPVSSRRGKTLIEAENEAQARDKAMQYMRQFDDGYGGSQKEIVSLTRIVSD